MSLVHGIPHRGTERTFLPCQCHLVITQVCALTLFEDGTVFRRWLRQDPPRTAFAEVVATSHILLCGDRPKDLWTLRKSRSFLEDHGLVTECVCSPLHGPNASSSADPVQPPDTVVDPSSTPTTPVHRREHARREEHTTPSIDLRFLQDRRSYHKITHDEIPQSFLKSARQPVLGTPLADLLQGGHFRRAAETALDDLLHTSLSHPDQLLQLLYCRLACLVLIGRLDFAADEAVTLYDFLNSNASDAREALGYVPWELRVLLARLQLFSAQDGGRRGVMALYTLANDVRLHIRAAREPETITLWQQRLKEIGWRVADALVEMGELETAARHLDSLQDDNQDEILARKALLHIHTGNIGAARSCVDKLSDEHIRLVLEVRALVSCHGLF